VFHGQVSNMHVRVFDRFIGLDLCENKLGMVRIPRCIEDVY
jgi:hypothetical protein